MELQPIETDRAPIPRGPYNQAIRAGDTIYVAGQIPVDPATNQLVDGDAVAQARQVFENVKAILEANGATMNDVVKVNTYLTDVSHRPALAEVRGRYFTGDPPASTLVEVSRLALEGLLIEVEVTAAVPRRQAGG